MTADRKNKLHAYAACADDVLEYHGTESAVEAARQGRKIAAELGELTDEDLAVIASRKREYVRESM